MPPYSTKPQQPTLKAGSYPPSPYQQAIIDWLITGTGNAIVEAKAGSGKTSTLCMLADCMPKAGSRSAFLAFNRNIAEELKRRLPAHVQAATFHSVCNRALRKSPRCVDVARMAGDKWVQKDKVHGILDTMHNSYGQAQVEAVRKGVVQLVSLMKANVYLPNVDEEKLVALINRYDIEFDAEAPDSGMAIGMKLAREALTINNEDISSIDFDDMLYLTILFRAPLEEYDYLMVDEAQDTNRCQRAIIKRMLKDTSRFIAVGDPNQAIYGFRGADSDAMNAIALSFNCQTFPLSISYRCPRSVIELAQRIVPDIMPRDNAPEGTVKHLDKWTIAEFDYSHMVICRNTAPLISLAFKFIRSHKGVRVLGREIGEGLIKLIQKMQAQDLDTLAERLDQYTKREVGKALAKRQEQRAEQLMDQQASIMAVIEGLPETDLSVYAVIATIRRMFDDNQGRCTTLSTIHKAKGAEAHTVFILDPDLMPSQWARQAWQQQQERNLEYVAITRSLDTLYFLDSATVE